MSHEVLWAVHDQIQRLEGLDIRVILNLIGGEPTSNMDRLFDVLHFFDSRFPNMKIEMTTNGHWLESLEKTREFIQTVQRFVDPDGSYEDSITVRISHSTWHEPFRPHHLQGDGLQRALDGIWESSGVLYEYDGSCNDCGHEFNTHAWDCPECGSDNIEMYESDTGLYAPQPNQGAAWIYIEEQRDVNKISPTGRATNWGLQETACKESPRHTLTYEPDGTLSDVCCVGSHLGKGSAFDDPIVLLDMALAFFEQAKPDCSTCRITAKDWVQNKWDPNFIQITDLVERIEYAENAVL